MAIVEVLCPKRKHSTDWLLEKLNKAFCDEIVVIQPDNSAVHKTDKRDANALCELLWNNRKRLQGGQRPFGIRRIFPADPKDAQIRQLTNFRQHLITQRTRIINKIKGIINKHNMSQDAPTKRYDTKKYRQWITKVQLPVVDRLEVDINIETWNLYDKQVLAVEAELVKRSEASHKDVFRLNAIPGVSAMGAITLLSRIGDIKRFKTPDSLANYFGVTPGCHNSAGKHRVGGITKRGNAIARQVLNFAVIHVLRKDPEMKAWHKKIKNRRGAKTARVAVMRRLATIIWHILRWGKPFFSKMTEFRYDPPKATRKKTSKKVFSGIDNSNRQGRKGKTPLKSRSKTRA